MIKLQTESVHSDDKSGFDKWGEKDIKTCVMSIIWFLLPPAVVVNCCVSFLILLWDFFHD